MSSFSDRPERWRATAGMCALAFVVLASYAIARPAVESIFVAAHGSTALPAVWVAVAVIAMVVVPLYNRFATTLPLSRLFVWVCAISAVVFVLIQGSLSLGMPLGHYALYVWKDIYIVFLIEMLWTLANHIFSEGRARWTYGLFLTCGSLGGIFGSQAGAALAPMIGSEQNLWLVLPMLALSSIIFLWIWRVTGSDALRLKQKPEMSWGSGARAIQKSDYLGLVLVLIVLSQVAITLIDYQYNVTLEAAYPETDSRTAAGSRIYSMIDMSALVLQLLAGPILKVLQVGRTLMLIPLFLGGAVTVFAVAPKFATMAIAKVASKCFDYSIFRAAKEILYIPLSHEEKTQGKALIDILTYRLSKGAVSALLLLLQWLALSGVWLLSGITLCVVGVWLGITVAISRRHATRVTANAP